MQGSSKLTGAGAALLVFLGLTLMTPTSFLAALVLALLAGALVGWLMRARSVATPATTRKQPELRRVEPVAAPVVPSATAEAASPVAVDETVPAHVAGDEVASDPAPLFSSPGFGDGLPETGRLPESGRRIAPSGDAVPAPGQRDIPTAARSIYGDAAPVATASGAEEGDAVQDMTDAPLPEAAADVVPAVAAAPVAANDAGRPDRLRAMRGLGLPIERSLHEAGVTRFEQIAAWDDAEIERVASRIGYEAGRIRASNWVGQAQVLAERKRSGAA